MENNKVVNLVCSDCIGGRYFQLRKSEYKNPFIWVSIKLSDFIYLIENWEKINLSKIEECFTNNEYGNFKKLSTLIVDNKIKVYFHHHKQDDKYLLPKKIHIKIDDIDMAYKYILTYLKEHWENRLKRMSGTPIFCYNDKKSGTDRDLMDFINLKTSYKKILVTTKKEYKKFENENLKVYIKSNDIMYSTFLANELERTNIFKWAEND